MAKKQKHTETDVVTGRVDLTQQGCGFIISEETDSDIFVSQPDLHHALHGDKVKVRLYKRHQGSRPEGEVVEILSRARQTFVGKVEVSKKFAYLVPEKKHLPVDIFIPLNKLGGAESGQKAVARILEWAPNARTPVGEIIRVLGEVGDNEAEMHAILAEYELPVEFPPEVEAEAGKIKTSISASEISRRRDFRDVLTFTVDPADAKDYDDALSIRELPGGDYEVGVHIADVTYYVRPGSLIDKEAYERATSIYLVDRTVPMLPEALSNNLCSLRPGEDKLCFSVLFRFSAKGEIRNLWIGKSIIRSDMRFSYEEVQDIIETGKGDFSSEIQLLNKFAQAMRAERFRKGAMNFEKAEVKFRLDEKGRPLEVFFKENKESNQMIEEFMLLANKKVTEFAVEALKETNLTKKGKGSVFVFRVHDKPDAEKLANFSAIASRFGHQLQLGSTKKVMNSMNQLLKDVKGRPEKALLETLALRSMAKAEYSPENIGHYGLGFKYYTHFTSPIRRYPDMMVHRLLTFYLTGKGSLPGMEFLEGECQHCSDMERLSAEAERASIKYKQVEFMQDKVGQILDGVISGVTEYGIYVELNDSKCEGLVPASTLTDDYYEFEDKEYRLVGRRTGKSYQLGDEIKVEVWKANLERRQLDFKLAGSAESRKPSRKPSRPSTGKSKKR